MEKHSPTPWSCKNFVGSNGWTILAPFTTDESRNFAEFTLKKDVHIPFLIQPWSQFPSDDYEEMVKANVELIVKAVNNHEQLVKALKDVVEQVESNDYEGSFSLGTYNDIVALLSQLENN